MPDHLFTTLAWLKSPTKAPNLPRRRMIADSYAALNPPDPLWKLYLDEINRLQLRGDISEQDYHLLRFSMEAKNALMDFTFGEPEVYTVGTVKEVLEQAKAAIRTETEQKLDLEKEGRVAAEDRANEAEANLEIFKQLQTHQIDKLAISISRSASWVLFTLALILVSIGVYLSLPGTLTYTPANIPNYLIAATLTVIAILSILNLIFGTTVSWAIRKLEVWMSNWINRILARILIP